MRISFAVFHGILAAVILSSGCSSDDTEELLEHTLTLVYQEKRLEPVFSRMTAQLRQDFQDKRLGLFSQQERFADKYKSIRLVDIEKKADGNRRSLIGLVEETARNGVKSHRTFLARFTKVDGNYVLHDLIVEKDRRLDEAQAVARLLDLAPETVAILESLTNKIEFMVFEDRANSLTEHLVREMQSYRPELISVSFYNPAVDRGTADTFGISRPGFLVLQRDQLRYRIETAQLFYPIRTGDQDQTWYEGERVLAGAVARVGGNDNRIVYLRGCGERSLRRTQATLVQTIRDKEVKIDVDAFDGLSLFSEEIGYFGFSLYTNRLVGPAPAPAEGDTNTGAPAPTLEEVLTTRPILLVVDPKQSLETNEMQAITAFLDKGGRAAFLMEPNPPAGWTNLFAHLGLQPLLRHTLVDPEYKEIVAGPTWFNAHVYQSPITADFANRVERIDPEDGRILYFSVLLSHTLGFLALSNQPPGLETYPIAGTSTNGWAESRYEPDKPYEAEYSKDRDIPGPVPACWAIRHQRQPDGMRVFLSGDADFISDLHFQTKYSNWTFFRAMLNWLQNPKVLSIKPRPVNRRSLMNLN